MESYKNCPPSDIIWKNHIVEKYRKVHIVECYKPLRDLVHNGQSFLI